MSRSGKPGLKKYALSACTALLAVLPAACSRPLGWVADSPVSAGQRQAPFRATASSGDPNPQAPTADIQESRQKSEGDFPFRQKLDLPTGTLLTVRLSNAITANTQSPSESFQAILDEPVKVSGNSVLLRGTTVAGRIEAARASKIKRTHNYVRLTLDAISVEGRDVPVQTASLFVHGSPQSTESASSNSALGLQRGRRLTFRLTQPVALSNRLPDR